MERRNFVATSLGAAAGLAAGPSTAMAAAYTDAAATPRGAPTGTERIALARAENGGALTQQSIRSLFPRLEAEVFLNGAGGTPLSAFAEAGIERYLDFIRLGPGDGRREWWSEVWSGVRGRFADLIGAREAEIGLVECTKAGEQIVLDGLPALERGGNVVTNDLHFARSLHNLEGLRRAGRDVRIVRSEGMSVPIGRMADAIDDRTALVTVSLVSNVNGHVEAIEELSTVAHEHGAIVFADIIQAAGAIPIDVEAMGIDAAACSSYKWLYGIHGAGFLYVHRDVQDHVLAQSLFPGGARRLYAPFAPQTVEAADPYTYDPPGDARRYEPGHVSYLGYAAVHEGLGFISEVGVETLQQHSARLNRRLLDQIDTDRFRVLSNDIGRSPILSLELHDFDATRERLVASDVVISVGGDKWNQARISPGIYNTEADMDRLAEVLDA